MANDVLVIIPTYQRAKLVAESIESVLAQDYPHKRIAVVDDGSTDETARICGEYVKSCPGIVAYLYKKNGGCASARNVGLSMIRDDVGYVAFLDSDDRYLPGKLTREIELLQKNPKADFVYANYILYDQIALRETPRQVAAAGRPQDFALEHFLTNEAKSCGMLYRVQAVRDRRFREDLRYNEDSDFIQRVALEHSGIYSAEPSSWVRWHEGSKSRNLIEIHKAILKASLGILHDYPRFYDSNRDLADKRISKIERQLFAELVYKGCWEEAKRCSHDPLDEFILRFHWRGLLRVRIFMRRVKGYLEKKKEV